jgi:hypothetical protein
VENLQEWGEHFREQQHGATLTILRARRTIIDQSARIVWLENQWEETKKLMHAVGSGRADSRLKQAADLMRDAMRHKPETWNHAIDYYETIFLEKECPHDVGHELNGVGMRICLGCRADVTPENVKVMAHPLAGSNFDRGVRVEIR